MKVHFVNGVTDVIKLEDVQLISSIVTIVGKRDILRFQNLVRVKVVTLLLKSAETKGQVKVIVKRHVLYRE